MGDWMHINSMSVLGPNKWYEAGDERFHPDNIIWDARESNISAIISKETGKVVWKMGPDFRETKELRKIGQIIGQHHVHMIPQGLPGEGNILIFGNGGWAGYGEPTRTSKDGTKADLRDCSRVLEIDPVTMKILWEVSGKDLYPGLDEIGNYKFYSALVSSAQRLPNGNTLITEGSGGRLIEVTAEHEIVWEYISPYWGEKMKLNMIYRAYRVPYAWAPQAEPSPEVAIQPVDVTTFCRPGAANSRTKETAVAGVRPFQGDGALCVAADEELEE